MLLYASEYMIQANCICLRFARHLMPSALSLALVSAGSNKAARMAMIAITTNNSIKVKAKPRRGRPRDLSPASFARGIIGLKCRLTLQSKTARPTACVWHGPKARKGARTSQAPLDLWLIAIGAGHGRTAPDRSLVRPAR